MICGFPMHKIHLESSSGTCTDYQSLWVTSLWISYPVHLQHCKSTNNSEASKVQWKQRHGLFFVLIAQRRRHNADQSNDNDETMSSWHHMLFMWHDWTQLHSCILNSYKSLSSSSPGWHSYHLLWTASTSNTTAVDHRDSKRLFSIHARRLPKCWKRSETGAVHGASLGTVYSLRSNPFSILAQTAECIAVCWMYNVQCNKM